MVCCKVKVVFSECRTVVTYVEDKLYLWNIFSYLFHTSDEFRSEDDSVCISKIETVFDLGRCVSVIERYCKSTCLEDTEVDREPFEAVHKKYAYLVALLDTAAHEKVCTSVSLFVENAPCDLTAVCLFAALFNEFIFLPGYTSHFSNFRIYFNKCSSVTELFCVVFK